MRAESAHVIEYYTRTSCRTNLMLCTYVFRRSAIEYYAVAGSAKSPPVAVSMRQLSNVCETRRIIWLVKRREWKQNCHMFLTLAWASVFIKAIGMRLLYTHIIIYYFNSINYFMLSEYRIAQAIEWNIFNSKKITF